MCVESVLWHKHLPVRCTALVAAISPYRATREELRKNSPNFIEVYVDTPLEVCERRDPKGLSERARNKQISSFTGMDDPYEPPLKPASDHGHSIAGNSEKKAQRLRIASAVGECKLRYIDRYKPPDGDPPGPTDLGCHETEKAIAITDQGGALQIACMGAQNCAIKIK
jgi:hypothetical protein